MPLLPASKLASENKLELMGGDVDLANFTLQMRDKAGIKLVSAISDAQVTRTIEGASTIVVTVEDDNERTIQQSKRLGKKVDVNVNGLWWTFVGIRKAGRQLGLTFEEREVNILRHYKSWLAANRENTTRAEFVLRMIQEVKEVKLKWVIPELHAVVEPSEYLEPGQVLVTPSGQPVTPDTDPTQAHGGIPSTVVTGLTVKGQSASAEQINNANIIIQTGIEMGASTKVLVCSIMTAITESSITNLVGGDRDSVGVFQQRPSQGWPASRNVTTDARAFFKQAISVDVQFPTISYEMLCQTVQRSRFSDGSNYRPWKAEAEKFIEAYGVPFVPTTTQVSDQNNQRPVQNLATGAQYFTRGQVTQKNQQYILTEEDSWTCMNRLANEINWRAFIVSGTVYFVSEIWLLQSKPAMIIDEDTDGIDWIDYDYDEGKENATVTIHCHFSRWSAPPGSVVLIRNMGIPNGRWIVNEASRSLYSTVGTITLKKARPALPEPLILESVPKGFLEPGQPKPAGGRLPIAPPETNIQARIVSWARTQIGVPYSWGAEQPDEAFDCSGLTMAAYATVGIVLPRVAQAQFDFGPKLTNAEILLPADLVYFGSSASDITHMGIYIGDGQMIDAPFTGAFVRIDTHIFNRDNYIGATRPWQT